MARAIETLAVEVVDAHLLLAESGGREWSSPGFALRGDDAILYGDAARAHARRSPRRTESHFWDRLGREPLPHPHASAQTQADLVHGHLRALLESLDVTPKEVLLAVPGHYDRTQLALLLGIAEHCALPIAGWVDAAVAATGASLAAGAEAGGVIHLEQMLHRSVATHIRVGPVDGAENGEWTSTHVESSLILGAVSLERVWAKQIAAAFLKRTRFDPMHQAESEQALFDAVPLCLERLRASETTEVEIEAGGHQHGVPVSRPFLADAARPLFDSVLAQAVALSEAERTSKRDVPPPRLVCSSRWAGLPGFDDAVAAAAGRGQLRDVHFLGAGAAARACLTRPDVVRASRVDASAGLDWLNRWPVAPSSVSASGVG